MTTTLASAHDAVKLHADAVYQTRGRDTYRHHAVYLDIKTLLKVGSFRSGCLKELRRLRRPDLVVIPDHGGAGPVEDLVREAFGANLPAVVRAEASGLADELASMLGGVRQVLVADDALVTGETLISFRQQVYEAGQRRGMAVGVGCFVVVARPTGKRVIADTRRPFWSSGEEPFHYGELVFLPHADECPWCVERDLLIEYRGKLSNGANEVLSQRIRDLEGELVCPAIYWEGGEAEERKDLFTEGSCFGRLRYPAAFGAAASVAQSMIGEIESANPANDRVIVDVEHAVSAYFEAVLIAALLRTFQRRHLRFAGVDTSIRRLLDRTPTSGASAGLVGELGWAGVQGKLPADAVSRLLARAGDGGTHRLLKELIELRRVR